VGAAGVIPNHPAKGAAVVGCGIWAEGQMMFFGGIAQIIENDSGLYSGNSPGGIDLKDPGHVLAEIENYGDIAALSGERRAAAAAEYGCAIFVGQGDGGDDVVGIARNNYSDGDLAVVGAIGGVERAAPVIETYFTTHVAGQCGGKFAGIDYGGSGSAGEFGEVLHESRRR